MATNPLGSPSQGGGASPPTTSANAAQGPLAGITAPASSSSPITGLSAAQLALPVWVPVAFGSTQMTKTTLGAYLTNNGGKGGKGGLDPSNLQSYVQSLVQAGYLSANPGPSGVYDPATVMTALGKALGDASFANINISQFLSTRDSQSAATATAGGTTRFFKGGAATIGITTPGEVQTSGDAVAQQLAGVRLSQSDVQAITSILNKQEYARGAADIATAQAQQAAYAEAFQGGQINGDTGTAASSLAAGGGTGMTGGNALAALPPQYAAELQKLAGSGQLYGIDPQVIAAIAMAESSGKGGAINSEGYGGFFGLGANSSYAGGKSNPALLKATDPGSFATQAKLAASDFAGLLAQFGGDIWLAETAYQEGPNGPNASKGIATGEGVSVFQKYGIPQTASPTEPSSNNPTPGSPSAAQQANQGSEGQGPAVTPPSVTAGAAGVPITGTVDANGNTINPIPTVSPLPGGGSETVGQPVSFQVPTGTDYVLPPTATIVNNPETPEQATADYFMNDKSKLFQAEQLTNIFTTIGKMLSQNTGAAKSVGAPVKMGA